MDGPDATIEELQMWVPDRVQRAEARLRDFVNAARRHRHLRTNRKSWMQLCAALDAIGDTQLAVRAYRENEISTASDGANYLVAYGVLQVLYVQQDAAEKLAKTVGVPLPLPDAAIKIRDIRNATIGHPADYRRNQSATIVRISLSSTGFSFYLWQADGEHEQTHVDLDAACSEHTDTIGQFLEQVVERLTEEEIMHRKSHRNRPLSAAFSDHLEYAFEKIVEGIRVAPGQTSIAEVGFKRIDDILIEFQNRMKERQLDGAYPQSVDPVAADVQFALRRLRELRNGELPQLETRDGYAYLEFLRSALTTLQGIAKEIDDEYASDEP